MPSSRPQVVRLPLSVGLTSLGFLVAGVLLLPAGVAGMAALAVVTWVLGVAVDLGLYAIGFCAVVTAVGGWAVRKAWQLRPSDALIDRDGMRIDGGGLHGWSTRWNEVDLERTELAEQVTGGEETTKTVVGYILRIAKKEEKKPTTIAEAVAGSDMDSLREIHTLVVDRAGPEEKEPEVDGGTLRCASCGAIAAPADREAVVCRHCAKEIAVPPEVRERIQAASRLGKEEQRGDALVRKLLDQPGARSTAVLLGASFVFIGGAWPLTVAMAVHLHQRHALSIGVGIALFVLPFLLIADGFFLSCMRLVDRHALAGAHVRLRRAPGGGRRRSAGMPRVRRAAARRGRARRRPLRVLLRGQPDQRGRGGPSSAHREYGRVARSRAVEPRPPAIEVAHPHDGELASVRRDGLRALGLAGGRAAVVD